MTDSEKKDPMDRPEGKPDVTDLDKRLAVLEKQVRREIDMRIIGFLLENIKFAHSVLTAEEMKIYTEHLGIVIQNPEMQLDPVVKAVFNKLENDEQANNSMEAARILVQAKFKAQDLAAISTRGVQYLLGKNSYKDEDYLKGIIRQQRSA